MFEDAIKAAIENKDDEACREKLLQLITFGTDPTRIPKEKSTATTMKQRTQQVCKILSSLDRQPIEQHLVDVLWLVSCTISVDNSSKAKEKQKEKNSKDGEAKASEQDQSDDLSAMAMEALVTIIKSLLEDNEDDAGKDKDKDKNGNDVKSNVKNESANYNFMVQLQSHLDPTLLQKIGLITSENDLVKKMRLLNTKNYRQQKFNLLQEESEGYSKLLHALQFRTPQQDQPSKLQKQQNRPSSLTAATKKQVVDTKYIQQLIGVFQLDPNRVLDIAVDVLELQLYQHSQWSQQTSSGVPASSNRKRGQVNNVGNVPPTIMPVDWLKQFSLSKLPPLIGFKLKHLSRTTAIASLSSTGKSSTAVSNHASDNHKSNHQLGSAGVNTTRLLRTIAYLAKHKLLNLQELNQYLPSISDLLEDTYKLYEKKERKRVRSLGRIRLSSSSASSQKEMDEEMRDNKLIQEQKEVLFKTDRVQLLQIVLLEENQKRNNTKNLDIFEGDDCSSSWELIQQLFTLEEMKQITTLFCDPIAVAICDLVHNSISKWVKQYAPNPFHFSSPEQFVDARSQMEPNKTAASNRNSNEDGDIEMADATQVNHKKISSEETTVAPSLDLVVNAVSEPLLCTLQSGCISFRPILFCELCRLFGAILEIELLSFDDVSDADNKNDYWEKSKSASSFYQFLKSFLLPSLSLFSQPNPALSMELWGILKLMPYTTRYRLYREWRGTGLEKDGIFSKPLLLVESEMQAGKDARYVLKRLSNDNIRETSREVAKVTHSNPLVVFTTILNQIESYDNLVPMMVAAVRFVAPLSLDVLGYCILSRLCGTSGGLNRSRSKESGVNVSQWLQSLESFIGAFYKQCPFVEIRGILGYIMCRLRDGHVTELGVLSSLLKDCGGWSFADYSPAASLNLQRLEGRSGSTPLKRETMTFGVVEDLNKASSNHLRSVLLQQSQKRVEEAGSSDNEQMNVNTLGVSLLVLLAQARSRIIFHSNSRKQQPVKLIGTLYDTCQVVMGTLLDFVSYDGDEEHDKLLNESRTNNSQEKEDGEQSSEKDVKNDLLVSNLIDLGKSMPNLTDLHSKYGIDVPTAWMLCRPLIRAARTIKSRHGSSLNQKKRKIDNNALMHVVDKFSIPDKTTSVEVQQSMLPQCAWDDITPELFEIFFSYAVFDLFCPRNAYITEINRLDNEVQRQHNPAWSSSTNVPNNTADSSNPANDLERHKRVSLLLSVQLKQQSNHVNSIHKLIESKKHSFFFPVGSTDSSTENIELSEQHGYFPGKISKFVSFCVFPRSMESPDDAFYCSHFVSLLHKIETPGFSTLKYFDELIPILSRALYGVTEGEAANLSILLLETWKCITRWRYDKNAYKDEVEGKPGSFMILDEEDHDDDHKGSLEVTQVKKEVDDVEGKSDADDDKKGNEEEKQEEKNHQGDKNGDTKIKVEQEVVTAAETIDVAKPEEEAKPNNETKIKHESETKDEVMNDAESNVVEGDNEVTKETDSNANVCEKKKNEVQSISYDQYEALFIKWHAMIGSAALGCLRSKEYIHTRACLIVLTRIVETFPTRPKLGNKILKVLAPLSDDRHSKVLPDIRIAAQAYNTQLLKARDSGVWKEEDKAVVQARIRREKELAEKRKKKSLQQFEDMKRETQKINEEIGDGGRGPWEIRRRAPGGDVWGSAPARSRSPTQGFESGRGGDRRMGPDRDRDRDRDRRGDTHPRRSDVDRGGARGSDPYTSGGGRPGGDRNNARNSGADEPRGLEGRWTSSSQNVRQSSGPDGGGRGRQIGKRGRSPSPPPGPTATKDMGSANDGGDHHPPSKRYKVDPGPGALQTGRSPPHGGRRGGRR